LAIADSSVSRLGLRRIGDEEQKTNGPRPYNARR
jgi:hypothetical protein